MILAIKWPEYHVVLMRPWAYCHHTDGPEATQEVPITVSVVPRAQSTHFMRKLEKRGGHSVHSLF